MLIKFGDTILNTDHIIRVRWKLENGKDRKLCIDIVISSSRDAIESDIVNVPDQYAEKVWDYFAKDSVDLSS